MAQRGPDTDFRSPEPRDDTAGSIDLQFRLWLTITFAVIVAAFSAGDRLPVKLRLFAAVPYLLASAHLLTRWMFDGAVAERWV